MLVIINIKKQIQIGKIFQDFPDSDSRYKNAAIRHLTEEGEVEDMKDYGGMTHEGAVMANLLADLEIKLRKKCINKYKLQKIIICY